MEVECDGEEGGKSKVDTVVPRKIEWNIRMTPRKTVE
jgi:hypothetical protein